MTATDTRLRPRATRVRGHRRGCNCDDCARIYSRYKKHRRVAENRGTWQPRTDSAPWLAMLADCRAAGWTPSQMAAITGLDYKMVRILLGEEASQPQPHELRAATVAALRRMAGADRFDAAVPDVAFVDATGIRRRVQALAVQRWPSQAIAAKSGARLNDINRARLISAGTARQVVAAYRALAYVEGPSATAMARAVAKGWAPPAAWEGVDIDDPRAQPFGHVPVRRTSADLTEDSDELLILGVPMDVIAARLGVTANTLEKARERTAARERAAALAARRNTEALS